MKKALPRRCNAELLELAAPIAKRVRDKQDAWGSSRTVHLIVDNGGHGAPEFIATAMREHCHVVLSKYYPR